MSDEKTSAGASPTQLQICPECKSNLSMYTHAGLCSHYPRPLKDARTFLREKVHDAGRKEFDKLFMAEYGNISDPRIYEVALWAWKLARPDPPKGER